MLVQRLEILLWAALAAGLAHAQGPWPLHNDGLTTLVEWDHYSFRVLGQRLFLFSGEFHYWRFPVPELWRDLLEKVKAAGFNAFSIYNHWGYHNPSEGVLDFTTGAHNFTSIMALAKELGMYMIIRPGPYVNAEANAGGFPLWVTTGAYGSLRDDDERYTAAWTPYWTAISEVIKPHLVTNGGNVILFQIENELDGQWIDIASKTPNPTIDNYMQLLEDAARESGIDVPLTHNAPNMNGYSWSKDFSNATGNVDVVGLDSYPLCWSCNISECIGTNGQYVLYQVVEYDGYFAKQSPTQPSFMPEFQGGSYNPWGGPEGGCPNDIGADFANMFYRHLIYQRVTAISLYMLYGGTNWGWLAAPVVASSYDYSSPVAENRLIGAKYYETKLLTMFTRVAHDLAETDRLGNSTTYTDNAEITTAELRNPDTNAAFYVTLHAASSSSTLETFSLKVNTSEGIFAVPRYGGRVTIDGHQAKILVTDFAFGGKTLVYSTAEVLTYSVIDGKEILAFNARVSREATSGSTGIKVYPGARNVTVNFSDAQGMTFVELADGSRVVVLDRSAAYLFWALTLSNDPMAPENNTVLVHGPYLVRSAALNVATHTLELVGDLDSSTTTVTIFAPKKAFSVSWNGQKMKLLSRKGGLITTTLEGAAEFALPALRPWKYHDSLPEIQANYTASLSAWIGANHTKTANPSQPDSHNPVLYVADYGIHVGNHIYRATFPTTAAPPQGIQLSITGGVAFGYSAWLNGIYIGSYLGLSYAGTGVTILSFANATLKDGGLDNVLVIVMDNSGHGLRSAALNPRGITNATVLGASDRSKGGAGYAFTEWKITGTAGGEANIDALRGPLNEGGLYAERVGAHLPGFPDADWPAVEPGAGGLSVPGAGIRVFRTVVPLNVPAGLDASISFSLAVPSGLAGGNRLRALLFVNGHQYGRYNPYIGNQASFPVPPGILDYQGDNTVAITVWSQAIERVEVEIDWKLDYVHASGFDMRFDSGYLRPRWTEDRLAYA